MHFFLFDENEASRAVECTPDDDIQVCAQSGGCSRVRDSTCDITLTGTWNLKGNRTSRN